MTRSKVEWLLFALSTKGLMGVCFFLFYNFSKFEVYSLGLQPQILSPPLRLTVVKGDEILLPCTIINLGEAQIVWRHNGSNILAGTSNVPIFSVTRIYLRQDLTLQIFKAIPSDEGDYECSVTSWPSLKITHSVLVQEPASLSVHPKSGIVTVEEGKTVQIGCIPHGKPIPRITWSKRNGTIPLNKNFLNQTWLVLEKVSRKHSGVYDCIADSGAGRPAHGAIALFVSHAPEIDSPKTRVHGGVSYPAKILAIVNGDPKPEVQWMFEQRPVIFSDRVCVEGLDGNEASLIISSVKESDFGIYSLSANNTLGFDERRIEFTGVPNPPIVSRWDVSSSYGYNPKVTLVWAVECFSILIDYRLRFRAATITYPHHENEETKRIWTELTIPADPFTGPFHTKSFTISGLSEHSIYEAAIKARNQFGWSFLSETFYFSTFPNTTIILEDFEEPQKEESIEYDKLNSSYSSGKLPEADSSIFFVFALHISVNLVYYMLLKY